MKTNIMFINDTLLVKMTDGISFVTDEIIETIGTIGVNKAITCPGTRSCTYLGKKREGEMLSVYSYM